MLQIEPTSFCNLACPLCPAGNKTLGRERRHLKLDEFKGIIDDMGDYLLLLVMWSWGEPFLNPDLPAMIQYASKRDIKTVTSTNGQNIDENYLEDLLTSGLSTLIVAIDSVNENNYESYRKEGTLNKALDCLKTAIDLKKELNSNVQINMRTVVMKQNENEIGQLRELARQMGADIFSAKTVNPSCDSPSSDEGIVPVNRSFRRHEYIGNTYQRVRINAPCPIVWWMCEIHSNGNVVPCCYDYDGSMVVGNIRKQQLSDIWNGPVFRELRRTTSNNKQALKKCRDCGTNFKLSSTGWFVESINFNEEIPQKAIRST
ncbi:MAG: radical SAM/SPASM domain-containing protein [Halobacteriota archaeon]